MTALLASHLDRTRQPGFAQADASWRAPVGVAASAGNASNLLEEYDRHERARFAPENNNRCSGKTRKTHSLRVHTPISRGSETNAPPAPDAGGAFCIWSLFENSVLLRPAATHDARVVGTRLPYSVRVLCVVGRMVMPPFNRSPIPYPIPHLGTYGHLPRAAGNRSSIGSARHRADQERDAAARSSHGPKGGTARVHDVEMRDNPADPATRCFTVPHRHQ